MADDKQFKAGKDTFDAANAAAHNFSRDAGVKAGKAPVESKTGDSTGRKTRENLTCPRCGKVALHAEFPSQHEVWLKCSSCDFFMGMSHDDWHRMENSPNISEKIKKMAEKK